MYKSLKDLRRILIVPVSGSERHPWFQQRIGSPDNRMFETAGYDSREKVEAAREVGKFGEPEDSELSQRGIKRSLADTASLEELPSVIHHGVFVRCQVGNLLPVSLSGHSVC